MGERTYIAIDLKSFYASVECVDRGLDPLDANLVVADASRTEKTICLAVSPPLKAQGIPGRARLFEVVEQVRRINALRRGNAPQREFSGTSFLASQLRKNPSLELSYITAPPRMALYMDVSSRVYQIYLRYVAPEDIHVYSIDEVFMDVTSYLPLYRTTPQELAMRIILDVLQTTGITATAGIGTNLYLSKIAMDIWAKRVPADANGVRIATLDETQYRQLLWSHRPLTDFWRVGRGYARKLERYGMYTMGDVARCSVGKAGDFYNAQLLYRLFGINAELLIDHAWGWEPCTMADIKAFRPATHSLSSGQVLQSPHSVSQARLIVQEMADLLALDLVSKGLVTGQVTLTVGYDVESLNDPERRMQYTGQITTDHYGRQVPRHAQGCQRLDFPTASARSLTAAFAAIFDRTVDHNLLVRRLTLVADGVIDAGSVQPGGVGEQLTLFADAGTEAKQLDLQRAAQARELQIQRTVLGIKEKYGKNAILKGLNLCEGATARQRNRQIGGHQA